MKKMMIALCAVLMCMCMAVPQLALAYGCSKHPDADVIYGPSTMVILRRTPTQHERVTDFQFFCAECYEPIMDGGDVDWYDHTFDENGVCTVCGYQRKLDGFGTCPDHPDAGSYFEQDPAILHGFNSEEHELEKNWAVYCAECNKMIDMGGDIDNYPHEFVNGACTVCGYVQEDSRTDVEPAGKCPDHPDATAYWGAPSTVYSYRNEDYHAVNTSRDLYCSECNRKLDSKYDYDYERHIFEGSACKICGYDPLTDKLTFVDGGCENHPDRGSYYRAESLEYIPVDAANHSINIVTARYCSVCNEVISRDASSELALHDFIDGVCRFCGYTENTPVETENKLYGRIGYSNTNIQRCVTKAFYHYTSMTPGGMIDGDPETSFHWITSVEDERNVVPQFTFYLREQQNLSKMMIRNGNVSSEEAYNENARLNYIKLEFYSNDKRLGSQEIALADAYSVDFVEYAFSQEYENVDEIRAYLQKKGTTYNGTKNVYDVYVTDIAFE